MKDNPIKKAWKSLMAGVLYSGIQDAQAHHNDSEVLWFARSEWCQQLCEETNTDYQTYLKKIEKLCNIEKS